MLYLLPARGALSTLAAKTAPVDVAVGSSCGNAGRVSNPVDSEGVVSRVGRCRTAKVITDSVFKYRVEEEHPGPRGISGEEGRRRGGGDSAG